MRFLNNSSRHSEWRKVAKKCRRKRIRQQIAKLKSIPEEEERRKNESSSSHQLWLEEQRKFELFQAQEEARISEKNELLWQLAEKAAQERWQQLQIKVEAAREERARQAQRIKLEWQQEQDRLKEIKQQQQDEIERKHREEQELGERIASFIEYGGEIPNELEKRYETNPSKQLCPFFQKTGACRFKSSCSRNHIRPGISRVLLITNFYSHYSLEHGEETEHGNDAGLEYENHETYSHFKDFFYDVVPEFEKCGRIKQLKVCCNQESHLRGNLYVEYGDVREAMRSYQKFQGRWYGGKQLNVEFCQINSWKSAICGLHFKRKCPKGSNCNFLHVFRNPGGLFSHIDRSPEDFERNMEFDSRNWRWSESPENDRFKKSSSHKNHKNHRSKKRVVKRKSDRKNKYQDNCRHRNKRH